MCENCEGVGWIITPLEERIICKACDGSGKGCATCNESGWTQVDNMIDETERCPLCDGNGDIPNPDWMNNAYGRYR